MTVTQELSDGVVVRERVPSSEVVRARFGDVDGLRALAIAAIVLYQVVRFAGLPQNVAPALARLTTDASQGLALFVAISAFALAYPALAAMRPDGAAYLDVGRYAVKRVLRLFPAFLTVAIVAALLHPIAVLVNFPALSAAAPEIGFPSFVRDVLVFGDTTGNDGARAVGLFLRCYVLFPFALALWARAPRVAIGLAAVAGALDVTTPAAHAWTLGALVPLVLGIAAADLRAQHHRLQRFGLPLAAIAAALAFALEPRLVALAGTEGAPAALRVDPIWSLAWFGAIAGIGASQVLQRIAGFAPFRLLGAASYAISLVAMPVAAFAVRQAPASLGRPAIAATSGVAVLIAGFALWQIVDRRFAADALRRAAAERPGATIDRILGRFRAARVVLGSTAESSADAGPEPDEPARTAAFYAPPPRPAPADLAVLSTRTGSADDLAAEIIETKRRLTERTAAFFAADSEPAPETATIDAVPADEDRFAKPGFYKRVPAAARPAAKPVIPALAARPIGLPAPAPAAASSTAASSTAVASTAAPSGAASSGASIPVAATPLDDGTLPATSVPARSVPVESVTPAVHTTAAATTVDPPVMPAERQAEPVVTDAAASPAASDFAGILPPAPAGLEPDPEPPVRPRGRAKPSLLERVANHARRSGNAPPTAAEPVPAASATSPPRSARATSSLPDASPTPPAEFVPDLDEAEDAALAAVPEPKAISIEPPAPVRAPIKLRIGPGRDVPSPRRD